MKKEVDKQAGRVGCVNRDSLPWWRRRRTWGRARAVHSSVFPHFKLTPGRKRKKNDFTGHIFASPSPRCDLIGHYLRTCHHKTTSRVCLCGCPYRDVARSSPQHSQSQQLQRVNKVIHPTIQPTNQPPHTPTNQAERELFARSVTTDTIVIIAVLVVTAAIAVTVIASSSSSSPSSSSSSSSLSPQQRTTNNDRRPTNNDRRTTAVTTDDRRTAARRRPKSSAKRTNKQTNERNERTNQRNQKSRPTNSHFCAVCLRHRVTASVAGHSLTHCDAPHFTHSLTNSRTHSFIDSAGSEEDEVGKLQTNHGIDSSFPF